MRCTDDRGASGGEGALTSVEHMDSLVPIIVTAAWNGRRGVNESGGVSGVTGRLTALNVVGQFITENITCARFWASGKAGRHEMGVAPGGRPDSGRTDGLGGRPEGPPTLSAHFNSPDLRRVTSLAHNPAGI